MAISSMVNPFDEKFKNYIININDSAKLLEVNLNTNKNFYSRVKRASGLLLSKRNYTWKWWGFPHSMAFRYKVLW